MSVRRIPKNYRHPTGLVSVSNGISVGFEGMPESDFAILVQWEPGFMAIESQPLRIEYRDDAGKLHHYTPDYLVTFVASTGRKPWLVEVKDHTELQKNWADYFLRFRAAMLLCKERGWLFQVFSTERIRGPRLENIKRLRYHRRHGFDELKTQKIVNAIRRMEHATFNAVLEEFAPTLEERLGWLPVIWNCIARQRVFVDLSKPILGSSRLWIE